MFDKIIYEQKDILYIYSEELGFARMIGSGWAEDTTDEKIIGKILRLGTNAFYKSSPAAAPVQSKLPEFPKYVQATFDWGVSA